MTKAKGAFLNAGPEIISLMAEGHSVVFPCRTNRFIADKVDLYINQEKKTDDFDFDPRFPYSVICNSDWCPGD